MKPRFFLFVFVSLVTIQSFARLSLMSSVFYAAESSTTATTTSAGRQYYSFDGFANFDSKGQFLGGFHVHQISMTDTATSTTTYSSLDMGPSIMWVPDKKGNFSVYAAYNVSAKGSYQAGGATTTSEWTGTSILGSIGVQPEVGKSIRVGVLLNYYSASYSREIVSESATTVSYSRSWIFPSLVVSWRD